MSATPIFDRRSIPRKRVLFSGVIAYGEEKYFYKCLIRHISAHGARITVPKGQPLPPEVHFINLFYRTGHKARVAWHKGDEAGLAFLSSINMKAIADPEPASLRRIAFREAGISERSFDLWHKEFGGLQLEQAKRMKNLERENARLQRLVADLCLDLSRPSG